MTSPVEPSPVTMGQVRAYLKENLRIEIRTSSGTNYYSSSTRIGVKLFLGNDLISESFEEITEGKSDSGYY